MADIFSRMAGVSQRLLRPAAQGGFGSGTISLIRNKPVAPPVSPKSPPVKPEVEVIDLHAQAFGVAAELIGTSLAEGVTITATDKRVISSPIAGGYKPEDRIRIDGKDLTILRVRDIVGAGTVSAVEFIVRG